MILTPISLRFIDIGNRGDLDKERVHFEVMCDCDIGNYIILATTEIAQGRVYCGNRPAYWFASQLFKAGDHLILYSKVGSDTDRLRKDGYTNHFLYWGKVKPLFGSPRARVVVAEINTWDS